MNSVRRFLNGRLFLVIFVLTVFVLDLMTSLPAMKDSTDVMFSGAPPVLFKAATSGCGRAFPLRYRRPCAAFCDEIMPFLASGLMTIIFAAKCY